MKKCIVTFRSVTPAQRGEEVLRRAGMECWIRRTPRWMEEQGCGYSLQLNCRDAVEGVRLLREHQIPFRKLYLLSQTGRPVEMHL